MQNHSPYQKKIIARYYDNREQIDEQRLAELVTNLYLAETDKQKQKLWKSAEEIMTRLAVPPTRMANLLAKKDAALLAEVVKDVQAGKISKPKKPEPPRE